MENLRKGINMKLKDLFNFDINLDPEPAAGDPEPAAEYPEYLTKEEFSIILKKELKELLGDIQAANRSKAAEGRQPEDYHDILKKYYEEN